MSGKYVAFIDPHRTTVESPESSPAGVRKKLSEVLKFSGHVSTFDGIFGVNKNESFYEATLFRFPLRQPGNKSKISTKSVTIEHIKSTHFKSFKCEAPFILLFLKNVVSISLYEMNQSSKVPELMFSVKVSKNCRDEVRKQKVLCREKEHGVHSSLKSFIQLYGTTVCTTEGSSLHEYHWLILNIVGTTDSRVFEQGQALSSLPCVGLASQVSMPLEHSFSCDCASERIVDCAASLLGRFKNRTILPWKSDLLFSKGQAFCFLPLPIYNDLPIHVHGSFAVSDDRRSITWHDHDERNNETDWNEILLLEMIAPAYSLLLMSKCKLFSFSSNLCSPTKNDQISAYSLWPSYNEIKNNRMWNELLDPVLSGLKGSKVLWSDAEGGKWVSFDEAYFAFDDCPDIVIETLLNAGLPITILPPDVYKTVCCVSSLAKIVKERQVKPRDLRRNYPPSLKLSSKNVCELLQFILSDVHSGNVTEIYDIPLLPLLTGSCCTFKRKQEGSTKYLLTGSLRDSHNIIFPGIEDMLVDTALPDLLETQLKNIALHTQIKVADDMDVLRYLLKASIDRWAQPNVWSWYPGEGDHPPKRWLKKVWSFINKKNVTFNDQYLRELPIVPKYSDSNTYSLFEITTSTSFCYVSSPEDINWCSALEKLGFVVVDEYLTCKSFFFQSITQEHILDKLSVVKYGRVINTLTDKERFRLRSFFSKQSKNKVLRKQHISCLRKLAIFCDDLSVSPKNPQFISLDDPIKPFLCPFDVSLPGCLKYPKGMLTCHQDTVQLIEHLGTKPPDFDTFCVKYWIPFAEYLLKHSQSSDGDDIILYIFQKLLRSPSKENTDVMSTFSYLKERKIVRTKTGKYSEAVELYDDSKEFRILLEEVQTPDDKYSPYIVLLKKMGLKEWEKTKSNRYDLKEILVSSMLSINNQVACSRGSFILREIVDNDVLTDEDVQELARNRFLLAAERPVNNYPRAMEWFTDKNQHHQKYYCIQDLVLWNDEMPRLIGAVKPILSRNYHIINAIGCKHFKTITCEDVVDQLNYIQSLNLCSNDFSDIDLTVTSLYRYIVNNSQCDLKQNKIWAPFMSQPQFLDTNKFVHSLPFDLKPFFYSIPAGFKQFTSLWNIRDNIEMSDCLEILKELKSDNKKNCFRDSEIQQIILNVIHWLYDKKYEINCKDMLLLTSDEQLEFASFLVYDDREWCRSTTFASTMKQKSFNFVHPKIAGAVAKHFHVQPLSLAVAPSSNFEIQYTRTGQHESITNRISKIVQDYESDIDIFKELIQNADDAEANEVKFLIDWRRHPESSLFSNEMKPWQGPALLAYNDSLFSEKDLDNICKVAGESKKHDPTKIGRFGVGFCATYHLTDLPSFVTGKFLTIFDPHTCYLGSRVSPTEPGIRINLVQAQADLKCFKDQFVPYNEVFECDIFNLKDNGYPGTLFRFPFRNIVTSQRSEISDKAYSQDEVSQLIASMKGCAHELILFLKHINKISLFEIQEQSTTMTKLFSICRQFHTPDRINFLSGRTDQNSCATTCSIEVQHGSVCDQSNWIMCSYRADNKFNDDFCNKGGLLSVGEIAMKFSKQGIHRHPKQVKGKIFCFLPLPICTGLNFHVNSYFVVSKDRRYVPISDENASNTQWNIFLSEEVLNHAFIVTLKAFIAGTDMRLHSVEERNAFLKTYYQIWYFKDVFPQSIAPTMIKAIKNLIPTTPHQLIWSEVNGGAWLSANDVVLFSDNISMHLLKDISNVLLKCGIKFVAPPHHVKSLIEDKVKEEDKALNYERFITDILFPLIDQEEYKKSWEVHLLYILQAFRFRCSSDNWANKLLKSKPCIPCQSSLSLKNVWDVVDYTQPIIAQLFEHSDGRFPIASILEDLDARLSLIYLGMSSSILSLALLVERATTVNGLEPLEHALSRSSSIVTYVEKLSSDHDSLPLIKKELSGIPFLHVYQKPDGIQLPWLVDEFGSPFSSPSELYSRKRSPLVFTVAKTTSSIASQRLLSCDSLDVRVVVLHLRELISATSAGMTINKETKDYLDDVTMCIYRFLDSRLFQISSSWQDCPLTEELRSIDCPLWHDQAFRPPTKIVVHCNACCLPYLTTLSRKYLQLKRLICGVFQVQDEVSWDTMISLLKNVHDDYPPPQKLSDELVQFVIQISLDISSMKLEGKELNEATLYLPDTANVMRDAAHLACDDYKSDIIRTSAAYRKHFESGSSYFVHHDIPRHRAIILGVYPLLDAVMKTFEDENFMSGEDYGQQEDLCVRLNSILSKYPADASLLQEFVQNAEDAHASEVIFVLDHRVNHPNEALFSDNKNWKKLQQTPALCVINNRKFSNADIEGIARLGEGSKGDAIDSIGKFGIGFNVAYHVTDCPSFLSCTEDNVPENLCVFDPTFSFVSKANERPGKRWKVKPEQMEFVQDQFNPYLINDISEGKISLDPKDHGYVVFRLPLTRMYGTKESRFPNGKKFSIKEMQQLLATYGESSKEVLLFLNNIKSLSAIEIQEDGQYICHFSVESTVPPQYKDECNAFVNQCEHYKDNFQSGNQPQSVSLFHRLDIVHQSMADTGNFVSDRSSWLIQRVLFGAFDLNTLQLALQQNLRAVGGVATRLKKACRDKFTGRLFCFLPLPICTPLPVHVHGHFVIDDSRKHLEDVWLCSRQEVRWNLHWNLQLVDNVIAPAYYKLVVNTRMYLLDSKLYEVVDISKYLYSLFPRGKQPGQLEEKISVLQHIVQTFYIKMQNCKAQIFLVTNQNQQQQWLALNDVLFHVETYHESKTLYTLTDSLCEALIALGMKIITSASHIYWNFDRGPRLLNQHEVTTFLSSVNIADNNVAEIIKENLEEFLKFCLKGIKPKRLPQHIGRLPLILSLDGCLQRRQKVYSASYCTLLPSSLDSIIDKKLASGDIGGRLKSCQVIVPPDLQYISSNIPLTDSNVPCLLDEKSKEVVLSLWSCLQSDKQYQSTPIDTVFLQKPVIPTTEGFFYPMCLCKTVIGITDKQICRVLGKLGYRRLDMCSLGCFDKQLLLNIDQSIFSKSKDVVCCFRDQVPLSVDLNDHEVQVVMQLLQSCSKEELADISPVILKLKIFHHASKTKYVSLDGCTVFLLPEGVPIAGISIVENYNNLSLVRVPDNDLTKTCYESVIPNFDSISIRPSQFYCSFILPHFKHMDENDVIQHIDFIIDWENINDEEVVLHMLKNTAFLKHNGTHVRASELYDPCDDFFSVFRKDKLPNHPWHEPSRIFFLTKLGLCSKVTYDEWVLQAKSLTFSEHSDSGKYDTLYSELMKLISQASCKDDGCFSTFLKDVSKICFMLCDGDTIQKIDFCETHFGKEARQNSVVKFGQSVFYCDAFLAFNSHTVLPQNCDNLMSKKFKEQLDIVHPLKAETVMDNLMYLCDVVSKCVWTSATNNPIEKLFDLFMLHYKFLNENEDKSIDMLKKKSCIVIKSAGVLKIVQPTQVVQHLQDSNLEPFCYQLPPEIAVFKRFIEHIDVQEHLTGESYETILSNICVASEGDLNDLNESLRQKAITAFNSLIRCLRHQSPSFVLRDGYNGPLLSDSYQLLQVDNLVYNDAKWYSNRAPKSFNFLLEPEPDDTGSRQPPRSLGVPFLSEIIKEVIHKDCASKSARCVEDELFHQKKRECRCIYTQRVAETLCSPYFLEGMCRIYYADHQCHPPEAFKEIVLLFMQYELVCLATTLRTVLYDRDQLIPGSEDSSRLCFLSRDDGILFMSPHCDEFDIRDLLKQVASELNIALGGSLKSEQHIISMIECSPEEIRRHLTSNRVQEYSMDKVKSAYIHEVGSEAKFTSSPLREALIIVNYEKGEMVKYYSPQGQLLYANVIQGHDYTQGTPIIRRCIEIVTEDTKIKESDNTDVASFLVSPIEIFKILTLPQIKSLENQSMSPFASPVILAITPRSVVEVKNWVKQLYNSEDVLMYSGLLMSMMNLRVTGHLQYQLCISSLTQGVFNAATFQILECVVNDEFPVTEISNQPEINEQLNDLCLKFSDLNLLSCLESRGSDCSIPLEDEDAFEQEKSLLCLESSGSDCSIPCSPTSHITSSSISRSECKQPSHPLSNYQLNRVGSSSTTMAKPPQLQLPPSAHIRQITTSTTTSVQSRFSKKTRTPRNISQALPRFQQEEDVRSTRVPPFCEVKAKAWLEQAKVDYEAAQDLHGNEADSTSCKYPALMCFLCHDVVAKCLTGLFYTYSEKSNHYFDCTKVNLVALLDCITKDCTSHCKNLFTTCNEVVMAVSGCDMKSRFPSYHNPPCAPAAVYVVSDAMEVFAAVSKLMAELKSVQLLNKMIVLPSPRFRSSLKSSLTNSCYPDNWDKMADDDEVNVCLLDPEYEYEEYQRVEGEFNLTLPNHKVLQIHRIQNKLLWKKFKDCSEEMQIYNGGIVKEEMLFHGTRQTDPKDIYEGDVGFDERFSRNGMWGHGNYFAKNANYSHRYTFRDGEMKKMFAVSVLTGISFNCQPDGSLRMPPLRDQEGSKETKAKRRYDSVTGITGGTRVYITYDNIHAYPAYLIIYM